jgi:uncharacterized membrane protein HdeD (DUF308 family)
MAHQWNEELSGSRGYPADALEAWLAAVPMTTEAIRRARVWAIAAGWLALLGGLVSILVPIIASVTVAIFMGWVLLFAGITAAVHAVSRRSPWRGLEAALSIIAGLYLLILPLSGTVTLTFLLAAWLFAAGAVAVIGAAKGEVPERWFSLFGGLLSLLLGVLIAVELPSSAAWAIGLLVGVNLLMWSVRAFAGARLLKRSLDGLGSPASTASGGRAQAQMR